MAAIAALFRDREPGADIDPRRFLRGCLPLKLRLQSRLTCHYGVGAAQRAVTGEFSHEKFGSRSVRRRLDRNGWREFRCAISRSIFARSLMTGAASLAFVAMAPAGVRAETVIVQGTDGAPGGDGVDGGDGEPGSPLQAV
jgi:hypothetical protein